MAIYTEAKRMGESIGRWRIVPVLLSVSVFVTIWLATSVAAVTSISQSYLATKDIPLGSIVSLLKSTSDEITTSTIDNADNIFGVAINAESALLSISGTEGTQVQVASSGTAAVLVSDINGEIVQGDPVTASPIAGVGMKATDNIRIIGMAQSDAKGGSKQTYKTKNGEEKSVMVTTVPVLVNVAYFFREPDKTIIPTAIQNVANGIAGKKVDSLPILISGGIFLIMLIVVVSIIYTMIHSSIISIGRNPMAQSAVYRDLIQLSTLVLAILMVGLVAIYLVLTKL
jgi:hypothetical protein